MRVMVASSKGMPRLQRSDAKANRERILEAASEVFARRGLDAEMREIAQRAEVGIGTLYRHFASREALVAAVVRLTQDDVLRRLWAVAKEGDPKAAVKAMILAGAEACQRFGALTEAILMGRLGDYTQFRDLLGDILQRGVQEGAFRPDLDVPLAVAVVESVFTSGAFQELAARQSYAGVEEAFTDFFLRAVAKDAGSSSLYNWRPLVRMPDAGEDPTPN